jgi:hypothetical protein
MGDVWHTVALKENANIKFKVHVEGLFFIDFLGDEYEQGLEAYEEYKKLVPSLAAMNALGFEKMKERNIVEYDYFSDESEVTHTLYVKKRKIISGRFLETELDPLYNLVKVVQDSGTDIQTIELADSKEPYSSFNDIPDVQKITSKEKLLHSLKVRNSELVSYHYMDQLAKKINQVKNERFTFKSEEEEGWLSCSETDKEGECVDFTIYIKYKNDGLVASNPIFKS